MAKFVDNEKFYEEMVSWKQALYKNREQGIDERPVIPEYIGECIWKIAFRYATKPNWRNSYNEDMVGDAVEECIKYLDRFDETKSKNPFSYFTQIVYYSFLRKISSEKKQLYIKYKTMNEFDSLEENSDTSSMESEDFISTGASPLTADKRATIYDFIYAFEEKKRKKKKPKETVDTKLAKLSPLTTYLNEELPA